MTDNFFVASFPANNSFVQFQQGFPVTVHAAPGTQHDLRRADTRRDLEAGDAGTDRPASRSGRKSAGTTPSPTTSRSKRRNTRDNNSFTFGADAVLTF